MTAKTENPPVVLSVAGTDPSGGAGVNVDLQVFRDHGVHGTAAMTAVVWQNTREIRGWRPLAPQELRAQLDAVADDFELAAIKIGMVPTEELVGAVARFVAEQGSDTAVVLDPVMVGGRGERELSTAGGRKALAALRSRIDLVTPNAPEALELLGLSRQEEAPEEMVAALLEQGWKRVLLKGGHLRKDEDSPVADWYATTKKVERLEGLTPVAEDVRGTGCQLSSAVAARRARGESWMEAVEGARLYLNRLLHQRSRRLGRGRPIIVRAGEM